MEKRYIIRRVAAMCVAVVCSFMLYGVNIENYPQTVTQPDGTKLQLLASGDEFFHRLHDKDGYTIVQHPETGCWVYAEVENGLLAHTDHVVGRTTVRSAGLKPNAVISAEQYRVRRNKWMQRQQEIESKHPVKQGAKTRAFSAHNFHNLVIFIGFADKNDFQVPFERYYNISSSTAPADSSIQTFYLQNSYGKIAPDFNFFPKPKAATPNKIVAYIDPYSRSYYSPYNAVANPNGYTDENYLERKDQLLKGAFAKAAAEAGNVNLDGNGDGYIDNTAFIYSGGPDAWNDLLWGWQGYLSYPEVKIGGAEINVVNFMWEAYNFFDVYAHEMGHSLGMPDLYHYGTPGTADPVGSWDLMGANKGHNTAYLKWEYGEWIDEMPIIVESGKYTVKPLSSASSDGLSYMISIPNSTNQYIGVEYRKKGGLYEKHYDNSGLLVYRIDRNQSGNGGADGKSITDEFYVYRPNGTITEIGDLPNATLQTGESLENTFLTDGKPSGVTIKNVVISDNEATFEVEYNAKDYLRVETNGNNSFESSMQTIRWKVLSDNEWTATTTDKWLSLSPSHNELSVTVANNTDAKYRVGTVEFASKSGARTTVYLSQRGADNAPYIYFPPKGDTLTLEGEGKKGMATMFHALGDCYDDFFTNESNFFMKFNYMEINKRKMLGFMPNVDNTSGKNLYYTIDMIHKRDGQELSTPVVLSYPPSSELKGIYPEKSTIVLSNNPTQPYILKVSPIIDRAIEVDALPGWLTAEIRPLDGSIFLVAEPNSGAGRSAVITLVRDETKANVRIKQEAGSANEFYFKELPYLPAKAGVWVEMEYVTNVDGFVFEYDSHMEFEHDSLKKTIRVARKQDLLPGHSRAFWMSVSAPGHPNLLGVNIGSDVYGQDEVCDQNPLLASPGVVYYSIVRSASKKRSVQSITMEDVSWGKWEKINNDLYKFTALSPNQSLVARVAVLTVQYETSTEEISILQIPFMVGRTNVSDFIVFEAKASLNLPMVLRNGDFIDWYKASDRWVNVYNQNGQLYCLPTDDNTEPTPREGEFLYRKGQFSGVTPVVQKGTSSSLTLLKKELTALHESHITLPIVCGDPSKLTVKASGEYSDLVGSGYKDKNKYKIWVGSIMKDKVEIPLTITYEGESETMKLTILRELEEPYSTFSVEINQPQNAVISVLNADETPIKSGDKVQIGTVLGLKATPVDGAELIRWLVDGEEWFTESIAVYQPITISAEITTPTGIEENSSNNQQKMKAYAKDKTIYLLREMDQQAIVRVFDISGQMITEQTVNSRLASFDVTVSGVYLIQVVESGVRKSGQVVVK